MAAKDKIEDIESNILSINASLEFLDTPEIDVEQAHEIENCRRMIKDFQEFALHSLQKAFEAKEDKEENEK